jgi:hypothetical protein
MNEERSRPIRRSTAPDPISAVANEVLVFTAADRVAPKKRRKRLKPPGIFLNETDREIIELVVAFGWLSRFQLADYFGLSAVTVHRRCHKLAKLGLLDDRSRGVATEVLYCPTRKGMRLVGMAEFRASTPSAQTLAHTAACFAAALRFMESPLRHGLVVTEREIQAAKSSGHLSVRVQRLAPWAQPHFGGRFDGWLPATAPISGKKTPGFKVPDLLLIKPDLSPPVACEVELTRKKTTSLYLKVFDGYETAVKAGALSPEIIYVTAEVCNNRAAITTSLTTALAEASRFRKLSVTFVVYEISQAHWNPREAQNGWYRKPSRAS